MAVAIQFVLIYPYLPHPQTLILDVKNTLTYVRKEKKFSLIYATCRLFPCRMLHMEETSTWPLITNILIGTFMHYLLKEFRIRFSSGLNNNLYLFHLSYFLTCQELMQLIFRHLKKGLWHFFIKLIWDWKVFFFSQT